MKRIYRTLTHNYSEGGLSQLFRKALVTFGRPIWSESEWNIYQHHGASGVPPNSKVACRIVNFDQLTGVGYYKAVAFPEVIRQRFDASQRCYGFYTDGCLATIGWSTRDYLELDRGHVFPCPGAIGLFDFFTFPAYSSRGIYTSALVLLVNKLHQEGDQIAYIAADPNNMPSIKGIERAGFRPAFKVRRKRRLGLSIASRSTAA
jgi:hypothetical protein